MKLLINSLTWTVQPLKFWEWISNFITHFIMDVITYSSGIFLAPRHMKPSWWCQLFHADRKGCPSSNIDRQTATIISVLFAEIDDGVFKWKHFLRYWPYVRGIYRSSVDSPHKGQWRGAFKWCFLCSAPEQAFEQTIEMPVISHAIVLIMTSLWCYLNLMWRTSVLTASVRRN